MEEEQKETEEKQNKFDKFDLGLKKRRPLWRDLLVFGVTAVGMWGIMQGYLYSDAYGQIVKFKYETLKASVMSEITALKPQKVVVTQKVDQKVEQRATPFRNKHLKARNQAKQVFSKMEVIPSDNRLFLPRIGKNVPLVSVPANSNWVSLEKGIQKALRDGVVVHPVSHAPGNFGNFFVTGHSSYYKWDPGRFKDVFALLHEVKIGDKVEVYWEGKKYVYEIKDRSIVPPTAIGVLNQPKNRSLITLMTCTPVGTDKNRLILVGELVQ